MNINQINLSRQHEPLADAILEKVKSALATGGFVMGPEVNAFENEFAEMVGTNDAITCSSGTSALELAFRGLGLGAGDEVIVPANTFIATAEAIALAGATPVFADVDLETSLITREHIEKVLTPNTRAIAVVHLYGHVVDMDPIIELAREKNLAIVEDTAQAHGAVYNGKNRTAVAGSMGDAGCYSFYPTKNLGSMGEGGGITLNDPDLAQAIRVVRDHGQSDKHVHTVVGKNARMHAIQAAALRIKLPHLPSWNERRREIAARYAEGIEGLPLTPVTAPEWSESVYHQFVLRAENRDMWRSALGDCGIGTGIHYPTPIHQQPAFAEFASTDGYPNCERLANEIFSLPMYPELTNEEVDTVIEALKTVAAHADAAHAA